MDLNPKKTEDKKFKTICDDKNEDLQTVYTQRKYRNVRSY